MAHFRKQRHANGHHGDLLLACSDVSEAIMSAYVQMPDRGDGPSKSVKRSDVRTKEVLVARASASMRVTFRISAGIFATVADSSVETCWACGDGRASGSVPIIEGDTQVEHC